jgi:hypothetical protein
MDLVSSALVHSAAQSSLLLLRYVAVCMTVAAVLVFDRRRYDCGNHIVETALFKFLKGLTMTMVNSEWDTETANAISVACYVLVSPVIIWVGVTDIKPLFMAFLLSITWNRCSRSVRALVACLAVASRSVIKSLEGNKGNIVIRRVTAH